MFYIYLIFAVSILFSYRSFRGGIDYLRYFQHELSKPLNSYHPFATVIVPCKGMDDGLAENLTSIVEQDYPDYEVVFVVDSADDPAVCTIEEVSRGAAKSAKTTQIVIAPKANGSGQKVENLREAVLHADPESQVFVFVDSDTRPAKNWLRYLVAPLEDPATGAASGYRWFISERPTLASEMRSVWNASIASALGPNAKSNFCWGGSTAIRRDMFEKLNIRERWQGTLSDDFTVTRVIKEAGLAIQFVPQALTASSGNCSLRELVEFTNRQMKITRVYVPHLWLFSFFGSFVFNAAMVPALLIVILSRQNTLNVWFAFAVLALVTIFSVGKSWLRLRAVELALAKNWPQVRRQAFTQNTLWIVSPALFLINCIAALLSRKMTWRGIRYELISPTETVIISAQKQ